MHVPRIAWWRITVLAGWAAMGMFLAWWGNSVALAGDLPGARMQTPVEFSARILWRSQGKWTDAQLFVKGNRYRIEPLRGVPTGLGLASVTIVRGDKNRVWHVVSQRRLVVEKPLTRDYWLPFSVQLEGEVRRTFIGDSMVDGNPALLYEVEVEHSEMREHFYQWVDPDQGVMRKLMSRDRDWSVEYQHVVQSKQPDYYFDPPLGYRKLEYPVTKGEFE